MTTLNLVLSGTTDDGYAKAFYSNTSTALFVGNFSGSIDAWYRFTGTSAIDDSTITSAVLTLVSGQAGGGAATPLTTIYADDQAAPTYPTSSADYAGRSLTTASVNWDIASISYPMSSPDLSAIIQELVDSYTPTAIQIMHKDRSSASNKYLQMNSANNAPPAYVKLDIDYTAGGGGGGLLPRLGLMGVG